MPKTWKLTKYEPKSFAGINEKNAAESIIVMFPDQNICGFVGDQGTNKTSNLACLKTLLGGLLPENAINSEDDNLKASVSIAMEDGKILDATVDKNNFRLYLTQEINGKPARVTVPSPKKFIQDLIGPLGVSPMFLKSMDGEKQVAWLRGIANLSEDQIKLEGEILTNYKTTFARRTQVNRDVKRLKSELGTSPFYDYDDKHNRFLENSGYQSVISLHEKGAGDEDAIRTQFEAATKEMNTLTSYRSRKEDLEVQKKKGEAAILATQSEIERLQKQLELQQSDLAELDSKITLGNEYIQSLEGAEDRLRVAQESMMNLNKFIQQKKHADDDTKRVAEYHGSLDEVVLLNEKLDKLEVAKMEFVQAITPEVPGMEVCVAKEMDVEFESEAYRLLNPEATEEDVSKHVMNLKVKNKTGIFFNGSSIAQLCESELWDLCLNLWEYTGVNVVFIENLHDLGTNAVEQVNKFAEKGIVFYSQMERGQKDLQITFQSKIPVAKPSKETV